MSTTAKAVSSNTVQTAYNVGINTLYSFSLKPQVMGELYDLYGKGLGLFDILYLASKTIDVKGHSQLIHSQGALERPVTLYGAISTGNAGANITFSIAEADFDDNSKAFLATNDVVFIPETYMGSTSSGPAKYQITGDDGGSEEAKVYTAKPFLSTYQITTEVPTATKLMVSGGNYAPGSQGAYPKSRGWYSDTFYTAIKRAAFQIEGGIQSDERYVDTMINGEKGMLTKASLEADFLLNSYMNDELFLGEVPTNTDLTMSTRESNSNAVYGTKGYWRHLVDGACSQEYVDNYEVANLTAVKDLFRSQGVINQKALFGMGSGLYSSLEDSGLEFLKEYSGGTNLMQTMGQMGVQFKAIQKNSILYQFVEIAQFDNPQKYGLSAYDWKNSGFIIPDEIAKVKMGDFNNEVVEISTVTLGYKNYNGEDRTRISGILGGVNGMGFRFVDTYDDVRGELLSEFMLIVAKINQHIKVTKAA